MDRCDTVSIRARSNERAIRYPLIPFAAAKEVSIRARSNERAIPPSARAVGTRGRFQSAPAQMSGRYVGSFRESL